MVDWDLYTDWVLQSIRSFRVDRTFRTFKTLYTVVHTELKTGSPYTLSTILLVTLYFSTVLWVTLYLSTVHLVTLYLEYCSPSCLLGHPVP